MAFELWMDGFDYYTNVLEKYNEGWGSYYNGSWYTSLPAIGAWGRCGTPGLKFACTEGGLRKGGVFGNLTELCVGIALKPVAATRHYLWVLLDGTETQLYCFTDPSGIVYFATGQPGEDEAIVAQSDDALLPLNQWHQLETRIVLDAAAGEIEARLDGDDVNVKVDETGLDTVSTANARMNGIIIGSNKWVAAYGGQGSERYVDDFFVRAGSVFTGDARIIIRYPIGAGTYNEWSCSGPGENWECVDEHPPNVADYIYSNTIGQRNTFAHLATPDNTTEVIAIAVNHYTEKLDAGIRRMAAMLRIGGVDLVGDEIVPSLGSFQHFQQSFIGPYTKTEADESEIGVKVTS